MFYSQFILAKKGPLGTIWIAAHLERKLRKNQVADTDIGVSVDSILFPEVPIALRLSSHLLLGVVRIYSRKVNYLFDDCSEALLKIKQAFRSTAVDLPPEESTAPYHSITLPETFDLDDFELPDNDIFQGNFIDHHVSTREQITLQDRIDGAVYSTSQFGLDERFGDGDTSQIGLEIDEESYSDKVAASRCGVSDDNAQASVQPHTALQNGRSDDEITDFFDRIVESHGNETASGFTETKDGARGPLTPGLQELKVSSARETLLSDDYVEADWSYSTDLGSLKSAQCLKGTSSIDQQEKDRELESLQDEMENEKRQEEHPIINIVTKEQECMLADEHSSMSPFAMPEQNYPLPMASESANRIVNDVNSSDKVEDKLDGVVINNMVTQEQECMLADEHSSMSLFAMPEQKYPLPMASESANKIVNDVNSSDKVEDKLDGVVINNQQFVTVKDRIGLESARASEAVASPCLSLVTTESEDPRHKGISEMGVIPVLEYNCLLEDDPTCQKVESSMNNMQISNSEGGSYPQCERWTAAAAFQLGSPGAPEVDVESHREPKEIETSKASPCDIVPCNKLHVLRSCNSHFCHPDISSGGKKYASDQITGPLCQELQSDSRKLSEQFENERFDQSEGLSKSTTSDLHEPEKILYLPHGPGRSTNALLIESLPEFTAGGEDSVARAKSVSGKKRSFTESTITVQSFNSVESFGVSQPRTTEIPDDDDLLSSILVGRRSSIVRIKSTPAALGAITSKRPRTTNQRYLSKRKVFMDDAMVLHGDMIRQQLTSTEDIRRIRRKAPCTCSEILTIQRQFIEDEIFCEPVFAGLSQELIYLHSKTFDLRGTVVSESNPNNTFLETCDNREFNMSTSGPERDISRPDGEHQLLTSDVKALHTEIAFSKEIHQTKHKLGPDDTLSHALEEIISDAKSVEIWQHSEVIIAVADAGITNDKLGPNDTPCHALTDGPFDSNIETSKHADVHIAGKDVEITDGMDASVVHGLEASIACDPVYVDKCEIQDGDSTIVENNNNCEGCLKPISVFSTCTNVVGLVTMEDEVSADKRVETIILVTENDENDIGKEVRADISESNTHELVTTTKEIREISTPSSINLHQHVNGIGNANLSGVNEDEVPLLEFSCQDKDSTIYSEKSTAYSIEFDLDKKDCTLDEENQILHEADNQISADELNCHLVDVFYDNSATINDTGFLNVENDEVEEEDDGIRSAEGAQNLENSGWSSRTRAVANYLQTLFDKESLVGRTNLRLDNLLTGKTRKEASRMFFETLVLKTKDYIHVEQIHSYDVVHMKPRPMLMKLEF